MTSRASHDETPDPPNQVRLSGTVSADAEERILPSGDRLVTVRVVVARPPAPRAGGRRASSDWVDCAVWAARPRRTARAWRVGDQVTVAGALRRRFFRVGTTTVTRLEVEVETATRHRRASPRGRSAVA